MKRSIFLAGMLTLAAGMFTGCMLDNDEPAGVEAMRTAKAEYFSAEATLKLAEAAYKDAQTAMEYARVEYQLLLNEAEEIKNSMLSADTEAEIALLALRLEEATAKYDITMTTLAEQLAKAEASYAEAMLEIEINMATLSSELLTEILVIDSEISSAMTSYNTAFANYNATSVELAELTAKSEVSAEDFIAGLEDAVEEAEIAYYNAVAAVASYESLIADYKSEWDEREVSLYNEMVDSLASFNLANKTAIEAYNAELDTDTEAYEAYQAYLLDKEKAQVVLTDSLNEYKASWIEGYELSGDVENAYLANIFIQKIYAKEIAWAGTDADKMIVFLETNNLTRYDADGNETWVYSFVEEEADADAVATIDDVDVDATQPYTLSLAAYDVLSETMDYTNGEADVDTYELEYIDLNGNGTIDTDGAAKDNDVTWDEMIVEQSIYSKFIATIRETLTDLKDLIYTEDEVEEDAEDNYEDAVDALDEAIAAYELMAAGKDDDYNDLVDAYYMVENKTASGSLVDLQDYVVPTAFTKETFVEYLEDEVEEFESARDIVWADWKAASDELGTFAANTTGDIFTYETEVNAGDALYSQNSDFDLDEENTEVLTDEYLANFTLYTQLAYWTYMYGQATGGSDEALTYSTKVTELNSAITEKTAEVAGLLSQVQTYNQKIAAYEAEISNINGSITNFDDSVYYADAVETDQTTALQGYVKADLQAILDYEEELIDAVNEAGVALFGNDAWEGVALEFVDIAVSNLDETALKTNQLTGRTLAEAVLLPGEAEADLEEDDEYEYADPVKAAEADVWGYTADTKAMYAGAWGDYYTATLVELVSGNNDDIQALIDDLEVELEKLIELYLDLQVEDEYAQISAADAQTKFNTTWDDTLNTLMALYGYETVGEFTSNGNAMTYTELVATESYSVSTTGDIVTTYTFSSYGIDMAVPYPMFSHLMTLAAMYNNVAQSMPVSTFESALATAETTLENALTALQEANEEYAVGVALGESYTETEGYGRDETEVEYYYSIVIANLTADLAVYETEMAAWESVIEVYTAQRTALLELVSVDYESLLSSTETEE